MQQIVLEMYLPLDVLSMGVAITGSGWSGKLISATWLVIDILELA